MRIEMEARNVNGCVADLYTKDGQLIYSGYGFATDLSYYAINESAPEVVGGNEASVQEVVKLKAAGLETDEIIKLRSAGII